MAEASSQGALTQRPLVFCCLSDDSYKEFSLKRLEFFGVNPHDKAPIHLNNRFVLSIALRTNWLGERYV